MNKEICRVKVIPCEVYSRVVGYFRPVSQWNEGKQQEFKERKGVSLNGRFRWGRWIEEEEGNACSG